MAAELTNNLVSTLEKIKNKRYVLMGRMDEDEQLLASVQAKIEMRTERLNKVIDRKNKRVQARKEYEKTIMETEAAYKKILESSALLLKSLQDQAGDEQKQADEALFIGDTAKAVNDGKPGAGN
jgi:Sjoegren syndrome nuclear autoantigen 1